MNRTIEQILTLLPLLINIAIFVIVLYYGSKLYKALMRYLESNTPKK